MMRHPKKKSGPKPASDRAAKCKLHHHRSDNRTGAQGDSAGAPATEGDYRRATITLAAMAIAHDTRNAPAFMDRAAAWMAAAESARDHGGEAATIYARAIAAAMRYVSASAIEDRIGGVS